MKAETEALADLHGQLSRTQRELAVAISIAAKLFEICLDYQQEHDERQYDYAGCRCHKCVQVEAVKRRNSREG